MPFQVLWLAMEQGGPTFNLPAFFPQIGHTDENLCRGYKNLEYLIHKYPP